MGCFWGVAVRVLQGCVCVCVRGEYSLGAYMECVFMLRGEWLLLGHSMKYEFLRGRRY